MPVSEPVALPGGDDSVPEEVAELVESIAGKKRVLRYTTRRKTEEPVMIHVFHTFDDEGVPVYAARLPASWRPIKLVNAATLENSLTEALEGEVLDPEDLDGDVAEWYETWAARGNPLDEVHVFVNSSDDGRYKDSFRFLRGDSEESIRMENGLPTPESDDKFVYHHLGTVREVLDGDFEADGFDLKQGGGRRVPSDLPYMVKGRPSKKVREAIEAEVNGDE